MNDQSHSSASRDEAKRLSALISEARSAKVETKSSKLDKFRQVLLKERKAGAKMREITEAVVKLGIEVSEETVRLWFKANNETPEVTGSTPKRSSIRVPSSIKGSLPVSPSSRGPRVARDDI